MEILFRHLDFARHGNVSMSTEITKMPDQPPPPTLDRELTTNIVAAYVRHNQIGSDQLGTLISTVHQALTSLGKPAAELNGERTPAQCRSVDQFTAIMSSASNAGGAARCSDGILLPAMNWTWRSIGRGGTSPVNI